MPSPYEVSMMIASTFSGFPDHVPPDLRWDHSLRDFARELDDPFLAVCRLHDGPDIFYARDMSQERPGWVITRHALQQEAFLDYEHFTSQGGSGLDQMLGVDWRLIRLITIPRSRPPIARSSTLSSRHGPLRPWKAR